MIFKINFFLLGMSSRKDYVICLIKLKNKYECQKGKLNWLAPHSFFYSVYFHGCKFDEIIEVLITLPMGELVRKIWTSWKRIFKGNIDLFLIGS